MPKKKKKTLTSTDTENQFYGRYIRMYVVRIFKALPFSFTLHQESTYDFYSGTQTHMHGMIDTRITKAFSFLMCAHDGEKNRKEAEENTGNLKMKTKTNKRLNTNVYSNIFYRICEQFFGIEAAVYRFILQIDLSFQ